MKTTQIFKGISILLLSSFLISCGSKMFEPIYYKMPTAKSIPQVTYLTKRKYPGVEIKMLNLDISGTMVPETENYFNNPGALYSKDSSAPKVIISIPIERSKYKKEGKITNVGKDGAIYKSDGYYNEAEQAIEGALIRQGFNVLDRSKFEAKLRDLRDRGNDRRYWWMDYEALIESNKFDKVREILDDKLKNKEITQKEYITQTDELNKISTVGLPGKNRDKEKNEMNDIAEVIRAAQTGKDRADYLMQINGVNIQEVSKRKISISDRQEVKNFLKSCPGLKLGFGLSELPPSLKTPWLRVQFNAKLIHIESGSIVWLGTHSLESPAAEKIKINIQVTKRTSNGIAVNNAIDNYNQKLRTRLKKAKETRDDLNGYYRKASSPIKLSDKNAVANYTSSLKKSISELENKLDNEIRQLESINSMKPSAAKSDWAFEYSISEPIYSPNFLFSSIEELAEAEERLKVHQSKLIKAVANSLIKTIIIK